MKLKNLENWSGLVSRSELAQTSPADSPLDACTLVSVKPLYPKTHNSAESMSKPCARLAETQEPSEGTLQLPDENALSANIVWKASAYASNLRVV